MVLFSRSYLYKSIQVYYVFESLYISLILVVYSLPDSSASS